MIYVRNCALRRSAFCGARNSGNRTYGGQIGSVLRGQHALLSEVKNKRYMYTRKHPHIKERRNKKKYKLLSRKERIQ